MKRGSKYRCNHLGKETLVVTERYNDKQYAGTVEGTNKKYLIGVDNFSEPHLCLAHVANMDCELTEIKEKT